MYSAPVMNPRKLPQFYNSPPGRANRRREIALAFQAAGRRDGIHSAGAWRGNTVRRRTAISLDSRAYACSPPPPLLTFPNKIP